MKDHGKDDYDDDFESEGEDDVIVVKTKKKSRAASATSGKMQSSRKSATLPARKSQSSVNRARASGNKKLPRELWLNSVKNGTGGLSTGTRKPGTPGKRTSMEYWMDALRQTGEGRSTNSTRMNTFTGIRPDSATMPYMSTSHYMREMIGTEKPKKSVAEGPGGKLSGRKPAYKSQEEYYDEILELKKQIVTVTNENTHMKSKLRRVEEDNAKKEKEIEQLLNPSKSEDMRRTLGDRKPDSGAVIHSMKQKILKLEQQLKEKEAAHKKLQSDIKATKIEETNIQLEAFYAEIVRLQSISPSKSSSASKPQAQTKESTAKVKALNETVLRLNESNSRLQQENKALKEDLSRQLEKSSKEKEQITQEYRDMNKRELMESISRLEKRLEKAEGDTVSILSGLESRQGDHQGKLVLEGSIAQRLDQLDRRETDLLEEREKLNIMVKKLKEDKNHYRRRCDEKDKENKSLKKEVEDLRSELEAAYADPNRTGKGLKSPQKRPTSGSRVSSSSVETVARARRMSDESVGSRRSHRKSPDLHAQRKAEEESERQRRIEEFEKKRAAKAIQRSWKGHKKAIDDQEEMRKQQQKVDDFATNRAARQIQKQWRGHHQSSDATTLIQSTLRGHKARKDQLRNLQFVDESDATEDVDDAAVLIQSAYRGHNARKGGLKRISSPVSSKGSRPNSGQRGAGSSRALDSEGESIDGDSAYSASIQSSARSYPSKSTSGRPRSPKPGVQTSPFRRSPALLKDADDDDDDDDIIF